MSSINVFGKKLLTKPVKKETVSKSGLIIVENDIDKNVIEAEVIGIGNEVSFTVQGKTTNNKYKVFYLKSNCIEIKLNDVLYHILNEDDLLCSVEKNDGKEDE